MIPSSDVSALLDIADVVHVGEGPPLALAHGTGGGVDLNFSMLIDALRADRTLIGIELPGLGQQSSLEGRAELGHVGRRDCRSDG